jgi:hypothetical protein
MVAQGEPEEPSPLVSLPLVATQNVAAPPALAPPAKAHHASNNGTTTERGTGMGISIIDSAAILRDPQ